MRVDAPSVQRFYRKLLGLYPREFRDRLGESMEQTFRDLWNEKRETKIDSIRFVLRTFFETAVGVLGEHFQLIYRGVTMQTILWTIGSSALVSFALIIPLMVMEVVNRRNFNEDFPGFLFFVIWLNLFALLLILLPVLRGRRSGDQNMANAVPTQGRSLLANPRSAALISIALILAPGILPLLASLGWISLDRLFNGPDPGAAYLPGMILNLATVLFPIAAGIVAGVPIARTRRAGGSLFTHPVNLIIVVFILATFAWGLGTLLLDQWPCFIGVPNCD